jgi:hypothetical protein
VFEPTEQVTNPHYTELLIVHLQVPQVILLLRVSLRLPAVIAVTRVVVVEEEVGEAECQLVALLEAPRDQAHVLEALFVQVLNEETKDALMVGPYIQQTAVLPARVVVGLEFIHYFFSQRVQTHKANVVDIFATCEFIC